MFFKLQERLRDLVWDYVEGKNKRLKVLRYSLIALYSVVALIVEEIACLGDRVSRSKRVSRLQQTVAERQPRLAHSTQ